MRQERGNLQVGTESTEKSENADLRTQEKGNVKQEQIKGKVMCHCIVASRKKICNFLCFKQLRKECKILKRKEKTVLERLGNYVGL